MARRRGNKKRRDVKRDSTGFRRAAKIGVLAAGIAAGGYKIMTSELGQRVIKSGLLDEALKARKGFKRDLLNRPKDFRTLRRAYDRNIGKNGEKIKEALKNRNKNADKIKASTTKLTKDMIEILQTKDKTLRRAKVSKKNTFKKAFKNQISGQIEGKEKDMLNDLVDALYYKVTEENIKDGTLLSHYKKAYKTGLNEEQLNSLLNGMLKWREEHAVDDKSIINEFGKLSEDLYNARFDNLYKQNQPTFFDKIIDRATGTTALKVKDLEELGDQLDFGRFTFKKFDNSTERIDMNARIKSSASIWNEDFKNMIVDRGLRVVTDENGQKTIIDSRESVEDIKNFLKKAKDTTPGKILLKPFDLDDKHNFDILVADKRDVNAYLTGATDNIMNDMMVYLNGSLYGITRDDNGIATLDKGTMVDVREVSGWRKKVTQELLGTQQQALESYNGIMSQLLDINQDGSFNLKNQLNRKFGKSLDPTYEKNRLIAMRNYINSDVILETVEEKSLMYDNALTTSQILNRNITGVSDELIDSIIKNGRLSQEENKMFEYLLDGSDEAMMSFVNNFNDTRSLTNRRLAGMIDTIRSDLKQSEDISHISIKKSKLNPLFGMGLEEQWTRDNVGQFRVEYIKEVLLENSRTQDLSMFTNFVNDVTTNDIQRKTLNDIGVLGLFENYMNVDSVIADDIKARFDETGRENIFRYIINNNEGMLNTFNEIMDRGIKDFNILDDSYLDSINELNFYNEYNDLTLIRKSSFSPKDIISDINKAIKSGDMKDVNAAVSNVIDGVKNLPKELFTAGRYDTSNITEATLLTQYSMSRLNYDLSALGLNLSSDSMSSPLATYLNFGLKRVAPIALGVRTLSYLNDESRRFLGSSMTEAAARGLSYVDIGARKFAYNVGLGDQINSWAETSVIHEYYFGDNHFDTAEERREWYEDGYSPVRKGRYWSFGSTSEYHGGAISYWEPNYLRRAESNYHDVSVYGSSEEKWAHSWLPTPTHPFSTVRALVNPYWLEKKHLKEGDRPYPLTSKMFTEGTPWGAVLNPTVGEILKPVRMLPEARLRLGHTGRDAKAVINRINERIKNKERHEDGGYSNEDLLIVSGTDIRNAEYVPYGNPVSGEMNFTVQNGQIESPGYDFMTSEVPNVDTYTPPTGEDYVQTTRGGGRVLITSNENEIFKSDIFDGMSDYGDPGTTERIGRGLIAEINNAIKNRRAKGTRSAGVINNPENSTYIYRNLVNEYNNYIDNWYGDRVDPDLINKSLTYDFARDAMYSASQISGMYGYLGSMFTNSDSSYTFRYESAEQMNSFSRSFWDASIGGLGGGPMEIARRFFPSEQRNRINVNPLVNNMPDWMPDSYKTGDPYTNIPKGEARLPGKGYETLNELHPDQFGDYGAFDRYKILADVAPNSREYKIWRNIAKNTVTDEALQEEMEKIAERTAKMSGNHQFFEYTYAKNNTEYGKGIVQYIKGSNIYLADKTVLNLAGVAKDNNLESALQSYIAPGQEITYRHDKNRGYDKENRDNNLLTPAVVYVPGSSESLNRTLIESGIAKKDVEDTSTIAKLGTISATQEASGAVQELIAHAPIPIIHNKFLRVDSAYESYMKENYYGSNFKTWDHPIKGFVRPMFNEQSSKSLISEALSLGIAYNHFKNSVYSTNRQERWLSNALLVTTNPTAFLVGNMSYILNMSNGANGRGQELTNWQKGAKLGVALGTVKYAWDNADNPIKSMATMGLAGAAVASKDLAWEAIEDLVGKMTPTRGALIGVGVGLTMSALKNSRFNKEQMFGKWAPKETRKKWDLDEYFDRLEYMKYSGLYKRAAKKARRKEKVDIEGIFDQIDKNKEKINKLNVEAAKLTNKVKHVGDKYSKKLERVENKKQLLQEQNKMFLKGGEWTKSAVAYKKAMESTMYGLDPNATKDELLASVPDQYKDHFQAFMEVTDKKERKKILKSVSPMMRRPLQAAWGMKLERVESNRRYFNVHAMPGAGWRGWKPNVNLKYVKMKTIENEGMLLSDFGYYNSEKSKATFEDAPEIENYDNGNMLHNHNIRSVMKGRGIVLHNVSIEKTRAPGIKIIGDVQEKAEDYGKAGSYKIAKAVYRLGSLF